MTWISQLLGDSPKRDRVRSDVRRVLAIGVVDVAQLANSARRAGYDVYAVDYHGDQDLGQSCSASLSLAKRKGGRSQSGIFGNPLPEALLELARGLEENYEIDASLLASGLDDSPEVLYELNYLIPILGNPPDLFRRVRDKSKFFAIVRRLELPFPETVFAHNFVEAKRASKDMGFPLLLKPEKGFGGLGIRKVSNAQELDNALGAVRKSDAGIQVQEYVSGTHASASVISVPGEALTLVVSEQLLGVSEVGQQEPFGYCGNIVPLSAPSDIIDKCRDAAERVVSYFGLIGSNGVDMVISKEGTPHVIEVNPRFQGTIECVERVLGLNVVEAHVRACVDGSLPAVPKEPTKSCIRLILFAKQRSAAPDLSTLNECRDVPPPETVVEEGEPLCSILVEDRNREALLKRTKQISRSIYSSLSSVN